MKYLLIILLFISVGCSAQFRTLDWGQVNDTTSLKAYAGGARGMFVKADTSLYVLCSTCSLSYLDVLQGAGSRKWQKIPKGSGTADGNTYVNAATYSGTTLTLTRNDGGTVTTTISGGSTYTASRGLNIAGNDIRWGGDLDSNVSVNGLSNRIDFYNLDQFSAQSSFSFGDNGDGSNSQGGLILHGWNTYLWSGLQNNGSNSNIQNMKLSLYNDGSITGKAVYRAYLTVGTNYVSEIYMDDGEYHVLANGLQINHPTTATGSRYAPISVNGNYADASGNITVSTSGGGTDNANVGSGFRILKPATQELKTLFAGTNVTIDSTTNTDGLTITSTDRYLTGAAYSGGTLTLTLSNGATVTTTISAGSTYSFYNGLTDSASTGKVILGGTLWKNTTETMGPNTMVWSGTYTTTGQMFQINNTSSGCALGVSNNGGTNTVSMQNNGIGTVLLLTANTGTPLSTTTSGTGPSARLSLNPSSTNSLLNVLDIRRQTSGTAAAGLGASISFSLEASDGSNYTGSQIKSIWTDATVGTRTSKLVFTTVTSTTETDILTITNIPTYADEAAATTAGLATGTMYKTSTGVLMIKLFLLVGLLRIRRIKL